MAQTTVHLNNADLELSGTGVRVTTRAAGTPHSPQPVTTFHRPQIGETQQQLLQRMIREWVDENGN